MLTCSEVNCPSPLQNQAWHRLESVTSNSNCIAPCILQAFSQDRLTFKVRFHIQSLYFNCNTSWNVCIFTNVCSLYIKCRAVGISVSVRLEVSGGFHQSEGKHYYSWPGGQLPVKQCRGRWKGIQSSSAVTSREQLFDVSAACKQITSGSHGKSLPQRYQSFWLFFFFLL